LREGKLDANDVKPEQASTQGLSAGQGLSAATETQQRATTDEPSPQPQALPIQPAVPPSFDQITDWLVQIIRQAADARRLREDNAALRLANDTLTAQVARLMEELRQSTEALSRSTAKSREFEDAMTRLNTPRYPLAQIPSAHPESQS
jgi:small-conductance mechanosensitive channel